jgi:hypothetical protein
MKKSGKPSFLSRKALLTEQEYEQYKSQQQIPQRLKYKQELEQGKQQIKRIAQEEKYRTSKTGAVGRATTGFFKFASQKKPVTSFLYNRNKPIQKVSSPTQFKSGNSYGKRGRPVGTYDDRYKAYGGVYGYRKVLNAQLRQQRLQAMQERVVSPAQQQLLDQIRQRDFQRQQNHESKPIPSTTGKSFIGGYHQEIDDYANLIK